MDLAAACNITQAAISNIVTDNSRKPSAPTLLKIAAELQASASWIISGDGQPFEINTIGRPAERDLLEAFRSLDANAQAAMLALAKTMKK